jgi:hypothetical protein
MTSSGFHCSTYRLEVLLVLDAQGATRQSNDRGRGIGVVGDWRAAVGAEDAVDVLSGRALASPALGGAFDGQLVLGDNDNERVGRTALALAVVAVVIPNNYGLGVHRVGDVAAQAVTRETHDGGSN